MPSALTDLCKNLQDNTEKLEEELKRNIVDCHKLLIENKATETKLALEKAKDFHYKEVLGILKEIVNSIKLIIYHEGKIKNLDDEDNFTSEELKRYSYVQRQVKVFSNAEEVITKREKRRVASEISLESLEAWELYLEKKEEEDKIIHIEKTAIPKRKAATNRRKKKFVSSTFNNFLDGRNASRSLDSILEDDQVNLSERLAESDCESCKSQPIYGNDINFDQYERRLAEISTTSLSSVYESASDDESFQHKNTEDKRSQKSNLSTLDILESLNQEYGLEQSGDDTKPKIIDVVYKKKKTD